MKTINQFIISIIILFIFVNKVTSEWTGVDWMSYLDPDLRLNQINIPGTHDSGTFALKPTDNKFLLDFLFERAREEWTRTQYGSIKDQLNIGVRYFDIRVAWHADGFVHIVHGFVDCMDEDGNTLFLKDVLKDCSEFLRDHPSETVILHLHRQEDNNGNHSSMEKQINEYISDYVKNGKMYNTENANDIPKLKDAKSKIVILTRECDYNGICLEVSDRNQDKTEYVSDNCTFNNEYECRIQDGCKLSLEDKWTAIERLISQQKLLTQWDSLGEKMVTINFMSTSIGDLEDVANEINGRLVHEKSNNAKLEHGRQYGWLIADFITEDVARYIYTSNFTHQEITKIIADEANYFRKYYRTI